MLLPTLALFAALQEPSGQPIRLLPDSIVARIDSVFRDLSSSVSPGCAVAVRQQDRVVFAGGYGQASLEHGVPITRASVFNVGSIAKQFTAISIVMLAREGRLSFDDDVRKFIPELPVYAMPVRVRHLLYHTSGLAESSELLRLTGYEPWVDMVRPKHVLDLISRISRTAFAPGSRYSYSNTNYELLALIVERVSGQALREFVAARVFQPLGMGRTRFPSDYDDVIPGRVAAYVMGRAGPYLAVPNGAAGGAGNLFTTAEDLLRWTSHVTRKLNEGDETLRRMIAPLVLENGDTLPYGLGLEITPYREHRAIAFSGGQAGYSADFVILPDAHLASAVLCNTRISAFRLNRRVLDILLASADAPPPAADAGHNVPLPELAVEDLRQFVGTYWSASAAEVRRLVERAGTLTVVVDGDSTPLTRIGARTFRSPSGVHYELVARAPGRPPAFKRRVAGQSDEFEQRGAAVSLASTLSEYVGQFHNNELGVTWRLKIRGDTLMLARTRFDDEQLHPVFADGFDTGQWFVLFRRTAGRVIGFSVTNARLGPVWFDRVDRR